ncbi:MAG: hypothetical protein DCC68_18015 [Planctomycetota bacterium]|nr:MAG: hypothetical protein DCC68_18015 [Planctomycetota bacterium]
MMAVSLPSGAWWKQLSSHLHERTHNRLRGLQIRAVGGRVSIQASAPCDRVRSQAEAAAREIVPDALLAMRIKVEGTEQHGRSTAPDQLERQSPKVEDRRGAPSLFAGQVLYRRMHRLVNGKGNGN